uniref:Palmitoyltransferase n=1 Tax=Ditylenchus dipsaci TaxID=166011 RepID=A0A915E5I4_9BILA
MPECSTTQEEKIDDCLDLRKQLEIKLNKIRAFKQQQNGGLASRETAEELSFIQEEANGFVGSQKDFFWSLFWFSIQRFSLLTDHFIRVTLLSVQLVSRCTSLKFSSNVSHMKFLCDRSSDTPTTAIKAPPVEHQQSRHNICSLKVQGRRLSGWQCPWMRCNAFAWFSLFPILVLLAFAWNIVWMMVLTSVDAAPEGRHIRPVRFERNEQHQHVIENGYCYVCRNKASEGTKHCRHCNKCIPGYDHHCKWNYKMFVVLVGSLTLMSLVICLTFFAAVMMFVIRMAGGNTDPFQAKWSIMDPVSWCVLCVLAIFCHILVFGFTAHLLNFHFMLWRNGLTTISYIQQKRQRMAISGDKTLSAVKELTRTISSQLLLLFIGSLTLAVDLTQAKRIPSQAQANCYPGCRCNTTAVECRNLHLQSAEVFRYVHPEAYSKLDTLVITGNNFGLLEDENLFGGSNQRHTQLTLVNLSSNGITSFGAQTLIGIPRVEYLYLRDNQLSSLEDVQPLNYLTSLKRLDLSSVFSDKASANAKADMLGRMLKSNHSFVDLTEVMLMDNSLVKLHEDTFCNIKGLTRLNLANNQLTDFPFQSSNCLTSLHMLDLSGNKLKTVPPSLWNSLPSLDTIDLSGNPLHCDCTLQEFHAYALEEVNSFLNQEATVCASPPKISGQKLYCPNSGLFPVRQGLRPGWVLQKWDRARNSQLRVPLVDGSTGYNQLKEDYDRCEDANVPPAFV